MSWASIDTVTLHAPRIYEDLLDELGAPSDPVDTEYEVLVAQAVMDLLAGRAP